MKTSRNRASWIALAMLLAACGPKQKTPVVADPGKGAQNGDANSGNDDFGVGGSDASGGGGLGNINPNDVASGKFIDAEYAFTAKAVGMSACDGDVTFGIDVLSSADTGQMLQIGGVATCFGGAQLDFAQMLGGVGAGDPQGALPIVKKGVVGLPAIGPAKFRPFRPMFPSFLAASKEELQNLNRVHNVQMVNEATGEAGSGTISMRVTSFGVPYTSPKLPSFTFKNTLRYEVTVSGFDTVKDKVTNMLFDKIEMVISLDPIAIPYISFKGKAADFFEAQKQQTGKDPLEDLTGGLGGGGGGALGGITNAIVPLLTKVITVNAEFHLTDQEGLYDDEDE